MPNKEGENMRLTTTIAIIAALTIITVPADAKGPSFGTTAQSLVDSGMIDKDALTRIAVIPSKPLGRLNIMKLTKRGQKGKIFIRPRVLAKVTPPATPLTAKRRARRAIEPAAPMSTASVTAAKR